VRAAARAAPCAATLTPRAPSPADAYAKQIGVYKQVKRTEGVSTTDIVGRMLLMTREHHVPPPEPEDDEADDGRASPSSTTRSVRSSSLAAAEVHAFDAARRDADGSVSDEDVPSGGGGSGAAGGSGGGGSSGGGGGGGGEAGGGEAGVVRVSPSPSPRAQQLARRLLGASSASRCLPTARRLMQFAEGRVPKADDVVVYMPGSWDVFNPGHVSALAAAREAGTFLLVGIYDDPTINRVRGHGLPILNLYERTLSLLSCKYVDEVIIGAPLVITADLITSMKIDVVVRGTTCDLTDKDGHERLDFDFDASSARYVREEAYAVPARLGILRTIPSARTLTALHIVARIMAQRDAFQRRYVAKAAKEEAYTAGKVYVAET
jgi:cytidyltransferase-like protein